MKPWKKWIAPLLAVLLAVFGSCPPWEARAADGQETEVRWLFRLEEPGRAALFSMPRDVEVISAGQGIYGAESPEAAYAFAGEENVACLERNCKVYLLDAVSAPGDPLYQNGTQWDRRVMEADEAYSRGLTGAGVRIAVIDSGVYAGHEDLQGAHILPGRNYVDAGAAAEDNLGHGTFVTGIIAAQPDNGVGLAGIAPGAEIVPLKCFSERETDLDVVLRALYDAVDEFHCRVINMSVSTEEEAQLLHDAVKYADSQGAVVVASVGNDGITTLARDPLNWPAAYEEAIGVGSLESNLKLSSFSQKNESVWVTAPGGGIQGLGITSQDAYTGKSGTSFSTPCVSAAVALALEAHPNLTRARLMDILAESVWDLGVPGWDNKYGWGLVKIPALLREAELLPPPEVTVTPAETALHIVLEYPDPLPENTVILAAVYDEAGRLLKTAENSLPAGTMEGELLTLSLSAPGGTTLKLFTLHAGAWTPLCREKEFILPQAAEGKAEEGT